MVRERLKEGWEEREVVEGVKEEERDGEDGSPEVGVDVDPGVRQMIQSAFQNIQDTRSSQVSLLTSRCESSPRRYPNTWRLCHV